MHRPALALGDARLAPGQLGHDEARLDAVGKHVAVVAIAGDDAVLALLQRRLQPDGDSLLPNIEVAETAHETESVHLPGLLLEAADEQHLLVEMQQLLLGRLEAAVLLEGFLQAVEREVLLLCAVVELGGRVARGIISAGLATAAAVGACRLGGGWLGQDLFLSRCLFLAVFRRL